MFSDTHALILVLIMSGVTIALRLLPYVVFGTRETIPSYILYLGEVLPYACMGMLIAYCMRNVSVLSSPHALPELIATAVVVLSYLWKRNTILSIIVGTAAYMFLIQVAFA